MQPLANGALVLALDTDFDGCMAIVQRLAAEEGVYLANSMNSLRLEGQKTLSFEIVQQFDWEVPDVVVLPGGNLGNVSAIAAGFDMMLELGLIAKRPRIVVAQAEAANPLYTAYKSNWEFRPMKAKPTLASAIQIGNPVSINKAIRALQRFDGIVEQASESELAEAAARADRTGMFNCPHTGVALAALEKIAGRGEIKRTDRVIVISTANGLKFSEFKTAYHMNALAGVTPRHANPPVELPNDYDAVRRAIEKVSARVAIEGRLVAKSKQGAPLEVWKFGGASLADVAAIERAVALISRHQGPLVVVASALGGVTDLLLEGANAATSGRQSRSRQSRCDLPPPPQGRRPRADSRRAGQTPRFWPRSTQPRANSASCASRSACSGTSRRAPAISWSRAASACRRRLSPPRSSGRDGERRTSMR